MFNIFKKKVLYSYKDEELIVDGVTIEELKELGLPDYVQVKKKGTNYWQSWGEIKRFLR